MSIDQERLAALPARIRQALLEKATSVAEGIKDQISGMSRKRILVQETADGVEASVSREETGARHGKALIQKRMASQPKARKAQTPVYSADAIRQALEEAVAQATEND
jgi:hypothetical protein